MLPDDKSTSGTNQATENAASTGNASNPSPQSETAAGPDQLLDKKAEKYLREAGNIEDMPDAEEQQEADEVISGKDE